MGGRKGVPASRYGTALMVMEALHITWDEYNEQPCDLVDELVTRLSKRALAEKRLRDK
jgi:hypothetical protein